MKSDARAQGDDSAYLAQQANDGRRNVGIGARVDHRIARQRCRQRLPNARSSAQRTQTNEPLLRTLAVAWLICRRGDGLMVSVRLRFESAWIRQRSVRTDTAKRTARDVVDVAHVRHQIVR